MDTKDLNNNLDVENAKSVEDAADLQPTPESEDICDISFELSNLSICEARKLPTISEHAKPQAVDETIVESKKRKRFADKFRDTFEAIEVSRDVKRRKTDDASECSTAWAEVSANIRQIDVITSKSLLPATDRPKAEKSITYRTHAAKRKPVAVFPHEKRQSQAISVVEKLPELIKRLIVREPETRYWSSTRTSMQHNMIYPVYGGCEEYDMIADRFIAHDNEHDYVITHVERIENPTLMAAFVLKRQELIDARPRLAVRTDMLFHCTRFDATEAIVRENFDWRLAGAARGHKYGHGTCFSPRSDFATQFGRPRKGNVYYTLLCHVVSRKTTDGAPDMIVPDAQYDASRSRDGKVIVKYDDNSAYPAYRITYRLCEKYHDDVDMRRADWYQHDWRRSNNYHRYNQHYSQHEFARDISFNHLGDALCRRAPQISARRFDFERDDRARRRRQQQSKNGKKGKNKRYAPY